MADLRNDTSWITPDIDQYVSTGLLKYIQDQTVDQSIIQQGAMINPAAALNTLADNVLLEEVNEVFLTADDEYFTGADGAFLDVPRLYQEMLDSWFRSMGTVSVINDKLNNNVVDQVLMVSLMKHLNGIKGTEQSMRLFFNLYFNAEVEVYQPKFDIAVIDGNWIPDVKGHIRDDYYYNEFAYVIRTPDDPSVYTDLFNSVYLKNVHPAGFKVFLEKLST